MKAIVSNNYGPPEVLELKEVNIPVPGDHEVLIRIHAATVTAGDCELRRFQITPLFWLPVRLIMGVFKPRINILGQELAGTIEALGQKVTQFKVGDQVFTPTDMSMGAYAEYKCMNENGPMVLRPTNMRLEEAATIPTGGLNGLYFLKKGNIKAGEKVLIIGAGGSIGTYAIQIAKSMGAIVTAIDSAEKLSMLKSIGSDEVIDYKKEDFTKNGKGYDVILDVADKSPFFGCVRSLNPGGRYLRTNPNPTGMLLGLWVSLTKNKKVLTGLAGSNRESLNELKTLIEQGKIKAVIDRTYTLEEMVEAHKYVDTGKKIGNVVISIFKN